ncbi:MAG: DUF72 domain-containing protein [Bacteroidetes bacterium]|nr:DUF72 domain-containing protein [Bacteroidota bacterium]
MAIKKVYIGTSGWSYKHWKGLYYPNDIKSTDWLTFYAKQFDVTEINTSFYHLPKKQTIINWTEKAPSNFRFCPKISRYITHIKRLKEPEESLQKFFDVFEPMKDKMGPVLVQLPPSLKFDPEVAAHFFTVLKKDYRDYKFAFEVRHETWLHNDGLDLMAKYDIAFVISQSGAGFPYSEMVTSKNIYIRFHGPAALYASLYTDKTLLEFAGKFRKWIKEGHTIWTFFNNDYNGYAIHNAETLKKMMKLK